MRMQLKNAGKSSLDLGGTFLAPGGSAWFTDSELYALSKNAAIGSLFRAGTLSVLKSEADDIESQFVKPLIVQAPNGSLYQIIVSNGGSLSASAYTSVAPHDGKNL